MKNEIMKCDICKETHKGFVAYRVSKNLFGVACIKCYNRIKRKEAVNETRVRLGKKKNVAV